MDTETAWLGAAFFVIALVYAMVGQAGASGYIAATALFGIAPMTMKTTALALNLLVAGIGTFHFNHAGRLAWRNVYPFSVLGFPFSLLGGAIQLSEGIYFPVVGGVLVLSALQMARSALHKPRSPATDPTAPPFLAALATGAVIGFISGTAGTGAFVGSRYLSDRWLRGILALLLLISGVKLLW